MGLLDDAIREHLDLKRRRGADAVDISRQESEALGPVRRGLDGAPDLPDSFQAPPDEAERPLAEADAAPWEGEPTTALSPVEPDLAYEPPPAPSGYEPPAPPAYEPPAPASEPEPEHRHDAEPEPPAEALPPSEPAWRAYVAESAPDPEPPSYASAPESAPFPEPEPESDPWSLGPDPEPEPDPGKAPDPPSRFARLRIGRKKADPAPPAPADAADEHPAEEPPPAHSSFAPPGSPAGYEPPPLPERGSDPPRPAPESDIVPADDEGDPDDVLEETPDFLEETPEHDRLWFEQRPPRDFNFDD